MDKKKDIKQTMKGVSCMSTLPLANHPDMNLKDKIQLISRKAKLLKTKDGMVELNPSNKAHKEWFDDDKFKGN